MAAAVVGTTPVVTDDREPEIYASTLYDWQREALHTWRDNHYRGVIEAATGTGKTRLGVAATFEALKQGIKVLVLVPTQELQQQWHTTLGQEIPQARVGRLGGNHRDSFSTVDVLIAIVNSAAVQQTLRWHQDGLIIADECHRYAAPLFRNALQKNYAWRLGLTATYTTNEQAARPLDEFFGSVIYRIWYDRALAENIISPFDIALVGVHLTASEREIYDDLSTKISSDNLSLRNYLGAHDLSEQEFFDLVTLLASDSVEGAEHIIAQRFLANVAQRRKLLSECQNKFSALTELAPAISQAHRAIVFGATKKQAIASAASLTEAGLSAEPLSSGMPRLDRIAVMKRFQTGTTHVVCAPRILDEGINVPEADFAVISSGSQTPRQTIQRLGRIIRKRPAGPQGRLVYLFAHDTIEDPTRREKFLPEILPFAREYLYFDLASHLKDLIEFLTPEYSETLPEPQAIPTVEPTAAQIPEPQAVEDFVLVYEEDEDFIQVLPDTVKVTDDAVRDYLKLIGNHPLLSAEEEVQLGKTIEIGLMAQNRLADGVLRRRREMRDLELLVREGEEAFHTFLVSNLRLVVSLAKKYNDRHAPWGMDFLDLIQEGNLGLVRAIQKWDYTLGHKFSTYATWWIRQAITRALADLDRPIRLPVHVVENLNKIIAQKKALEDEQIQVTTEILAEKTGLTVDKVSEILAVDRPILSLQYPYFDGEKMIEFGEAIIDDHHTPEELVTSRLINEYFALLIEIMLSTASERDSEIVKQRHGLNGEPPATLDEIGKGFGITRERVRQIHSKFEKSMAENLKVRVSFKSALGLV